MHAGDARLRFRVDLAVVVVLVVVGLVLVLVLVPASRYPASQHLLAVVL